MRSSGIQALPSVSSEMIMMKFKLHIIDLYIAYLQCLVHTMVYLRTLFIDPSMTSEQQLVYNQSCL